MSKKNLWKRRKPTIAKRDNWKCHWCYTEVTKQTMTADHLLPRSLGGLHNDDNLVTSCYSCNTNRKNTLPNPDHCPMCESAYSKYVFDLLAV